MACLSRCYVAATPEAFDRAMAALHKVSKEAHSYVCQIDKNRWTLAHLPFNCLGNLTSNDAKISFSSVNNEKSAGDVYSATVSLWENSSKKLYSVLVAGRCWRKFGGHIGQTYGEVRGRATEGYGYRLLKMVMTINNNCTIS